MTAPDFKLPDQNGKIWQKSNYSGHWLLIYFYPKDDTPGCTKEACNFRDDIHEFAKREIAVIGVSKDSVASHLKFSQKYNLNFTLLSDPGHQVIETFGSWGTKSFMGKKFEGTLRNSYLIDPKGEIAKEYKGVNPLTHAADILSDFDALQK